MGMGYAGNHAFVISDEHLMSLCPDEYAGFMDIFLSPYVTPYMVRYFLNEGESLKDTYSEEEEVGMILGSFWKQHFKSLGIILLMLSRQKLQ